MKMNSVITRLEIEEDIIQVKLMNVEKNPLFVADVFETISREGVNIDMISSVMLEDEMRIDFTCDAKAQSALNKAIEEVKKNHPRIGVFASKNVGKLVVEGHMENEVGFASKLFKVLGDNQIPFAQVTTSEVSISYVIEKKYLKKALEKILPYQRGDFEELFKAMDGYSVNIRFLDPPLHEFLPHTDDEIKPLAESLGMTFEALKERVESLKEFNPMMGHRGCRLAVTYPEIAKMQTKAVIRAAIEVQKAHPDWNVEPEIMIPLVCEVKELKYVKKTVVETADAEIAAAGVDLKNEVGTMIEIPRAALTADDIAKEADFFCFGTNDLTQMTFGFSRDDAGKFLNAYYDAKIFENDPFAKLDQTGVGKLMEMAIELGKPVNPSLHVGICGEHGGDPASV